MKFFNLKSECGRHPVNNQEAAAYMSHTRLEEGSSNGRALKFIRSAGPVNDHHGKSNQP